MLKSPLTHRCSLACVCFALIQYSPSSSRCWVSAGDCFTTWMGERRVWMAPDLLARLFCFQRPWMSYAIQPISLNITQFITPIIVLTFLVPVGGLSAPLARAYWLKDQSKVPQITFTKAVWRKWNPSVMRANIPTNAEIRALDGGVYGSAEILHLVASPLMRQPRWPSQFLFFPDF